MKPGDIALVPFPTAEATTGKLRPILVVSSAPGVFDDFIVCMVSSRISQMVANVDEVIDPSDSDFQDSGLKARSVVRIGRLATLNSDIFAGRLGCISGERLKRILGRIRELFT